MIKDVNINEFHYTFNPTRTSNILHGFNYGHYFYARLTIYATRPDIGDWGVHIENVPRVSFSLSGLLQADISGDNANYTQGGHISTSLYLYNTSNTDISFSSDMTFEVNVCDVSYSTRSIGLWQQRSDYTNIDTAYISHDSDLINVGDDIWNITVSGNNLGRGDIYYQTVIGVVYFTVYPNDVFVNSLDSSFNIYIHYTYTSNTSITFTDTINVSFFQLTQTQ